MCPMMYETISTSDTLAAVEAFLRATNMSPSAFGKQAVNDPNLVRDLRLGERRLRPHTTGRIFRFIERNKAQIVADRIAAESIFRGAA